MQPLTSSDDLLVDSLPPGADEAFFDRFYFNLHGDSPTPLLMIGAGTYPGASVVDGYVLLVLDDEQRNLRFSTEADGAANGVGPLTWSAEEPLQRWRLQLGPNPHDVECDVTWTARTAPWRTPDIVVDNGRGGRSDFSHFFQSGRYDGWLRIDGREHDVAGWWGQRDRSRGVRVVAGGQGMHLWVQAQFRDHCIAFIMDESRDHQVNLLDGAVLHVDGRTDEIVDVSHDLRFNDGLDLVDGTIEVRTATGATHRMEVDATAGGGFLSGGGYGGAHGTARGRDHLEHDVFPLDGSVTPRTLDMPLTDRPTRFRTADEEGAGVLEFAVTRSPNYTYLPSDETRAR